MKKKSSVTNRVKKEIKKAVLHYKNITTARNSWEQLGTVRNSWEQFGTVRNTANKKKIKKTLDIIKLLYYKINMQRTNRRNPAGGSGIDEREEAQKK